MYFATEAGDTRAARAALTGMIRKDDSLHWLALVDGAFDHGTAGLALAAERHLLYDYDGMADLVTASPYLVPLSTDSDDRLQAELLALLRHRKDRPMLSLIGSSATPAALTAHFRRFANALTDDRQEFILRFADTRVLAGLPGALSKPHWDGLTAPIAQWVVLDREGCPQRLPIAPDRQALSGEFELSPAELAALVAHGEADAILAIIAEDNPEALTDTAPAAAYRHAAAASAMAVQHAVTAFPDIVALAYLAILSDGAALRDPALNALLQRKQWTSGKLISELADFVD